MIRVIKKILPETAGILLSPMLWILTLVAMVNSLQHFFFLFSGERNTINYFMILLSKLIYFLYFIPVVIFLFVLNSRLSFLKAKLSSVLSLHLLLLILSFLIHQSITFLLDRFLIGSSYYDAYQDALFNNPNAWIDIVGYLLLLLTVVLVEFRGLKQENELKCIELEHMLTNSRLNELRTKIHPRFLFNTLFSIKTLLLQSNNKQANKVLTMLSDFLRITVYGNEMEETELEKEIHFITLYFEIEKKSLSNFSYELNIDEGTKNMLVPTALLQPVAEAVIYEVNRENQSEFSFCVETKNIQKTLYVEIKVNFGVEIINLKDLVENLPAVKLAKEKLFQLYSNFSSLNIIANENKSLVIRIIFPVAGNN